MTFSYGIWQIFTFVTRQKNELVHDVRMLGLSEIVPVFNSYVQLIFLQLSESLLHLRYRGNAFSSEDPEEAPQRRLPCPQPSQFLRSPR